MKNSERPTETFTRKPVDTHSAGFLRGEVSQYAGSWERRSMTRELSRDCICLSNGGSCYRRVTVGRCDECRSGRHNHGTSFRDPFDGGVR